MSPEENTDTLRYSAFLSKSVPETINEKLFVDLRVLTSRRIALLWVEFGNTLELRLEWVLQLCLSVAPDACFDDAEANVQIFLVVNIN